uniref:Uncharacterized protein n=1 Tax=Setaria italica TaxID=4555 RepID=K3YFH2_SETIT
MQVGGMAVVVNCTHTFYSVLVWICPGPSNVLCHAC